ncbi:putative phage terminase large subunit [Eubacterium sp. CAG:115]|nr:putative phage terminase large subunit [Eubacterium sp. CAG:115]
MSAEAYSKHGFNIHGVVFDELHTQPNRKLFDVMTKGSGDARMQPLYFLITTAGTDTHSICYETHQKAKDIIEGRKIDPTFYPVIYGADESDDWTDPKVWKKANPSLDITVGIDKVKAACDSAKQNPGEENAFRRFTAQMNPMTGLTRKCGRKPTRALILQSVSTRSKPPVNPQSKTPARRTLFGNSA